MRTIETIDTELDAAKALMDTLRAERSAAIIAATPYKAGDEFVRNGTTYKVKRISAHPARPEAFVACQWITSSKRWSQGEKILMLKVGEKF